MEGTCTGTANNAIPSAEASSSSSSSPSMVVFPPSGGAQARAHSSALESISDLLFSWSPAHASDGRVSPASRQSIQALQPPMHQRTQAIECVHNWNWARAADQDME